MALARLRTAFNLVLAAAGALFLLALMEVVPMTVAIAAGGLGFLVLAIVVVAFTARRRERPAEATLPVPAHPLAHHRHYLHGGYLPGMMGLAADGDEDDNGTA